MVASLNDQVMWFNLFLLLLVGFTTANHAWKPGQLYRYEIQARTMTGLHQVANQYVGIIMKAKLTVVPKTDSHISLKIHNSHYAQVNTILNGGWTAQIPDQQLDYHLIPMSNKPFEIKLRNGTVEKLIVEKNLPVWQINIFKSIASQLQIDTKAINLKKSRLNELPNDEKLLGVFKTLEDSVTGKCIMVYDISPLPHHILKSQPQLAPHFQINDQDKVIEIIKTQNYSACQQHIMYNYGMSGMENWKPGSNHMGQFMTRTNIGRIIITGDLNSYTIQSSQSTSKVIMSPHIYNKQKGIVASTLNLTLEYITNTTDLLLPISDPYITKSLAYEYNPAHYNKGSFTAHEEYQRQKREMNLTEDLKESSNMSENFSSESSGPNGDNLSVSVSELTSKVNIFDPYLQQKNKNAKFLWFGGSNNSSNNQGGTKNEPMFSDNDSSSSSSSSISSSEEFWQPQPQLNMPANVPFLPYFIGYEGYSIQAFEQIDSIVTITTLSQQIAYEMQNPNIIIEKNTLTKFNILVRVIRTLNTKQLVELTSLLYFNSSNPSLTEGEYQQEAWIIFYNAVAQSGTGPALVIIKHWIQNKQIESNKATELIAALPYTATYPNEEYMNAFFTLIKSSEVRDQKYLNQTAILAFTDLIYKTRTNNQTAHNYYPFHSFGRLVKKTNDEKNIYLSFFADQLKFAIMSNDSTNIQLYIKALGNTADPQVINIFRQYIEGKGYMSKFQKMFAITSLDRMTKVFPNLVRPMLYKLYQNPTESYEIRIAAVMQLMKTNPPPQILQRMAEYTYFDSSKEVSSAVKSIIESVAELKLPENHELAQNAKVAVNMLNPEVLGLQYSKNYIEDFVEEQRNVAYESDFTYIQSKDNIIPKAIFFNLRKKFGSMKLENQQIAALVSSYEVFLSTLTNQFGNKMHKYNASTSRNLTTKAIMSSKNVLEMLNFQNINKEPLEGNINFEFFGGPLFLTFNEQSIEDLSEYINNWVKSLEDGYKFNMIKLQNKYSMSIGFPTVNGLPFLYSLDIPTYLNFSGEINLKKYPKNGQIIPEIINITSDMNFLYCLKAQSRMGFIAPFNQRHYFTGLEKNTQIGIPIRMWSNLDIANEKFANKMQALNSEEKQKIFEYSTVAYTATDNIFEIKPPLNGYGSKIIQTRPMKQFQTTAGRSVGITFEVEIESEGEEKNLQSIINTLSYQNVLSNWLYPYADKHIYNKNITVSFNPHSSVTNEATFTFSLGRNRENSQPFSRKFERKIKKKKTKHDNKNNKEQAKLKNDEFLSAIKNGTISEILVLDSSTRLNGFSAEMSGGIRNYSSIVIDASADFVGNNSVEHYSITLGYSDSKMTERSRILLLYNNIGTLNHDKTNQVIVDTTIEKSQVPLLNYKEAIEENPTINFTGKIYFRENTKPINQITFLGNMTRSPESNALIRRTSIAKLCEQQMLKGNYISIECRRVIAQSNHVDELNIMWKYEKIPDYLNYFIQNIFNEVKGINSYNFYDEKPMKEKSQKEVETKVKYRFDYKTANISIKSPTIMSTYNNIPVDSWIKSSRYFTPIGNTIYPVFDDIKKDSPRCALDKFAATTFDNITYTLSLGNCWHVMFQTITSQEITVLVRENGFGQREVRILLGADIVDIVPTNFNFSVAQIKVNNNTEVIKTGTVNRYKDGNGNELLQVYISPGGVIIFQASRCGIELAYDEIRMLLKVSYGYRGKVAGLCGTFDGEPETDLRGPGNCQWVDPSEFVWSYALVDESCVGPPSQFRERFEATPCLPKATSVPTNSAESYTEMSEPPPQEDTCRRQQRLHTFREDGLVCFSTRPYETCSPGCGAVETANQQIDFHCLNDNAVARHWLEMVKIGATPDFSQKEITKTVEMGIPVTCSLR